MKLLFDVCVLLCAVLLISCCGIRPGEKTPPQPHYWMITFQLQKPDKTLVLRTQYTSAPSVGNWALDAQKYGSICILGAWPITKEEYEQACAGETPVSTKTIIDLISK